MEDAIMDTHFIFAYGTLKSDQPEHKIHCARPLSIAKASIQAELWVLKEGYPILSVSPSICLAEASRDCVADWKSARDATPKPTPPAYKNAKNWIQGELMELPLLSNSLVKMDSWEGFAPGYPSVYQRRIVWARDAAGRDRICWAYICDAPPKDAKPVAGNAWPPAPR